MIVSFDPGRNLGVAVVSEAGELLEGRVIEPTELATLLKSLQLPAGVTVLVGDGTGSAELMARLSGLGLEPQLVPEEGTSLEARTLYYQKNEPRWWARLVPMGMRSPAVPIDDYAAYAIALRWLRARPGAAGRPGGAG